MLNLQLRSYYLDFTIQIEFKLLYVNQSVLYYLLDNLSDAVHSKKYKPL